MAAEPYDDDDEDDFQTGVFTRPAGVGEVRKSTTPFLIVLSGASSVGKMFRITGDMVIGRKGADILLEDDGISRRHAQVSLGPDGSVQLTDLGSRNGTFRNESKVEAAVLQDGDKILIGNTTILKFSYQDALDEALVSNLYESATRDALTQVHNKGYLLESLRKDIAYSTRHGTELSLLLLDVDFFKKVNDTYGHQAGDYVLQRMAQQITPLVRVEDTLARYGGEEFVIVLREAGLADAIRCAERIRANIERTEFIHEGRRIPVTASIGAAMLTPQIVPTVEAFLGAADAMLYRAKKNGRNRVEPPQA